MITGMIKVESDEKNGQLELIHSKPISRYKVIRAYAGNAVVTYLMSFWFATMGMYVGQHAVLKEPVNFHKFLELFVAYMPAGLLLAGILALAIGWAPKLLPIGWVYFAYMLFVMYFANLLKMPDWARNISALNWIGQVPVTHIKWPIFILQYALAIIFGIIGLIGYKKRDLL
jgi:ABC-2 type transport system permease protein